MHDRNALQLNGSTDTWRSVRRGGVVAAAIVVLGAALLMGGCMMLRPVPKDLDYSLSRKSGRGVYAATVIADSDPVPVGKLHTWRIRVATADGHPVESAAIKVDGGMPQHGHGLPTRPQVTQALGDGSYLVEGMKFNMAGWWVIKFDVDAPHGRDTVVFNLRL